MHEEMQQNLKTPLHLSARFAPIDVVELVSKIADIDARDKLGHTPFYYALQSQSPTVINYFYRHLNLSAQNSDIKLPVNIIHV